ncbi:MAG TPA: gluconokinase [Polyangiales bacterium]|nr:gluconokinase [Polyangiales bacterium]
MTTRLLVLMGVSGSGKSTIGALLAGTLQWPYADADSFHSAANVAKMAAGHPLTDEDRAPWLQAIRAWLDERAKLGEPGIVTCSALKRRYRDVLRRPEVKIVYLRGTPAQIETRMVARQGHFFRASMLESQFAALEEPAADEHVITVSIDGTPAEIVDAIIAATGIAP